MKNVIRTAVTAGAAVALLAGVSAMPASAAPLGKNLEALKNGVSSATTDVQWRRHRHRGVGVGLGLLGAGIIAGAAIANSNQGYYYNEPYGYYDQPYGYYERPYHYRSHDNNSQPDGYEDLSDIAK